MTSSEKTGDKTEAKTADKAAANEAAPAVVRETTAPAGPPDTGRPTPPDVLGDSIHRPGMAPGANILTGPAEMTVGAHLRKGGKK